MGFLNDNLIDHISDESTNLQERALKHVEQKETDRAPVARLKHTFYVVRVMADRLAIAEYCLKHMPSWETYCDIVEEWGVAF